MEKIEIKKIKPAFTDERGIISDILEKDVKHIGIIESKLGSVRGNHYHKKSVQYMYMISGKMEMKTKNMGENNSEVKLQIIEEGDLITIPANVAHSFKAIEESLFLDITTESRSGTGYEDDTFRIEI